jgi:hypothetical protein
MSTAELLTSAMAELGFQRRGFKVVAAITNAIELVRAAPPA